MSLLSKLFGGRAAPEAPVGTEYKGFSIVPNPQKVEGGYRIGAIVEKDGKRHELIRADTIGDAQQARDTSVSKAKQVIDQLGEGLFS